MMTLAEMLMEAYDRGFQDGLESGRQEGIDYVCDMDSMRNENAS